MAIWKRTRWPFYITVVGFAEIPHLISIRQVTGSSMKPTLNPDTSIHQEIVLVDKTPITVFEYSTIRRGDIVTVRSIDERSQVVVKRVTALAGDKVVRRGTKEVTVIPEGYMWIEGDESFRSRDSNAYGPVPMGLLHGRVVAILWPFNRFGPLRDNRKGT